MLSVTRTSMATRRADPKIDRRACNAGAGRTTHCHPRTVRSPHMVNDVTLLAPAADTSATLAARSARALEATQAAPSSVGSVTMGGAPPSQPAFAAPVAAAR